MSNSPFKKRCLGLFAVSFFLLFILPRLMSHGMFLDGVTYATIARNMAHGLGSFWKMHYTQTLGAEFYGHPPLGIWLQSLAFRMFGDSVYVEAFYGLFLGLIVLFLIALFWKILKLDRDTGSWFPIFLFAAFPITSWMFANNMLENTLTIFVLSAAIAGYYGVTSRKRGQQFVFGVLSGVFVSAAVLTKGPMGLFPIVLPIIAAIVLSEVSFSSASMTFVGSLLSCAVVFGFLSLFPDARAFASIYWDRQVVASLLGKAETKSTRFYIVKRLLQEVVVPFAIGLAIQFFGWKSNRPKLDRKTLFLLLLSVSGSLPLIISPKQSVWYLFPSFPFYAMTIAAAFRCAASKIQTFFARKDGRAVALLTISALMLVAALSAMVLDRNSVRKERKFHEDFTVQPLIPEGELISVCPPSLVRDWSLNANMARQFNVSLTGELGHRYILVKLGSNCAIPKNCIKIHPKIPRHYILYKCSDSK